MPQQSNVTQLLEIFLVKYWEKSFALGNGQISKWIESLILFCEKAACFLPIPIQSLLVNTFKSTLLQNYRLNNLNDTHKLQKLAGLLNLVLPLVPDATINFLDEIEQATTRFSALDTPKLLKLYLFDLEIVLVQAKGRNLNCRQTFTKLVKLLEMNSFRNSITFVNLVLCTVFEVSSIQEFFLPPISVHYDQEFESKSFATALFGLFLKNIPVANYGRLLLILRTLDQMLDNIKDTQIDQNWHDNNSFIVHNMGHLMRELLARTGNEKEVSLRATIGKLLLKFLKLFEIGPTKIIWQGNETQQILERLNDSSPEVRTIFFECLTYIDPVHLLTMEDGESSSNSMKFKFQVLYVN